MTLADFLAYAKKCIEDNRSKDLDKWSKNQPDFMVRHMLDEAVRCQSWECVASLLSQQQCPNHLGFYDFVSAGLGQQYRGGQTVEHGCHPFGSRWGNHRIRSVTLLCPVEQYRHVGYFDEWY